MKTFPKSPYEQKLQAYDRGLDNLEIAHQNVRASVVPRVPDREEYVRYRRLVDQPTMLYDFVQRGLGTSDPRRVQEGAKDYLREMRKRFGE